MKKKVAKMGLKIAKFAKKETEKELKTIMKKHGVSTKKAKCSIKKVVNFGVRSAKAVERLAISELKKVLKTTSKIKRKVKAKVKRKKKK